jgi:hypothetical protein
MYTVMVQFLGKGRDYFNERMIMYGEMDTNEEGTNVVYLNQESLITSKMCYCTS